MLKKYVTLVIFLSLLFTSSEMIAQKKVDPPSPAPPPPPGLPIDGGVALLLIAGVGYGIKKLRE
tara:strand:- start:83865 stop:84056 length:192 start_codon:yes stop_codon:yes gene_type:complete